MPARPLRTPSPKSLLVGVGLFAIAGCSSSSATTVAVTHPTMIEVAPTSFLGDVLCAPDGPGLKRYVATLFDTNYVGQGGSGGAGAVGSSGAGPAGGEFQLPSSTPAACRAAVGFGYVVAGRRYRYEVDGFDTDDVRPRALGSREMVDSDGKLVIPQWHAECGGDPDPDGTVIPVENTIVASGACGRPFVADVGAASSVTIKLSSLLGPLRCGEGDGDVDHFEISFAPSEGETQVQRVSCASDAQAVFTELASGARFSASVTAFSVDGTSPLAGAACSARTRPAANVNAECGALSQTGTLRVDLPAALSLLGLACDTKALKRLEIRVPGADTPQIVTPPACEQPFDHGFAPGTAALTVTALDAALAELGTVTCHAEVTPGALVGASCELNRAN